MALWAVAKMQPASQSIENVTWAEFSSADLGERNPISKMIRAGGGVQFPVAAEQGPYFFAGRPRLLASCFWGCALLRPAMAHPLLHL